MTERALPPEFPEEQLLAASAVADGSATAAERALVEADPELADLARRMGSVRADLGTTDAPTAAWGERSLAAALAAAGHPTHDAVTTRRARGRWTAAWSRPVFAAAAALVLVAVAGAVVLPGLGGGGSDDVADAPSAAFDAELERSTSADDAGDVDDASGGASAMISTESAGDADDVAGDGADERDVAGEEPGTVAPDDADAGRDDAVIADLADVDLTGPDVVTEWVARLVDLDPDALERSDGAEASPCPGVDGLADSWPLGQARMGDVEVTVVTDGRDVVVVDPTTCDVRWTVRDVGD